MSTAPRLSTADGTVPAVRVPRGAPDDVELAALVAVLMATAAGAGATAASARSPWADPAWRPGAPVRARTGAWRLSGLPR